MQSQPRVAVLLCTFNGGEFLERQLDSIFSQTYQKFDLWVSDDGSSDNTIAILSTYRDRFRNQFRISIVKGPGEGFAQNFLSLLCNSAIDSDYFCFCDQDDVWDSDKLEVALAAHSDLAAGLPFIYAGRSRLIDENENLVGYSPLFSKTPSFRNALVQSIAAGNTMMLNRSARNLVKQLGMVDIVSHDWWCYLVVTAAGGGLVYDPNPTIGYRQHPTNVVGGKISTKRRLSRLLSSQFQRWTDTHILALSLMERQITSENIAVLETYSSARRGGVFSRLFGLNRSKVYRQKLVGNLGLYLAAAIGKL